MLVFLAPLFDIIFLPFLITLGPIYLVILIRQNFIFSWKRLLSCFFLFFFGLLYLLNSVNTIGLQSSIFFFLCLFLIPIVLRKNLVYSKKLFLFTIFFINLLITFNLTAYLFFGDFSERFNGFSSFAGIIGLKIERPLYLLSNGVNHYSIILASIILVNFIFSNTFLKKDNYKIFFDFYTFIHLVILIFVNDSRGAVLGLLFAVIVTLFFNKKIILTLLPLFPLVVVFIGLSNIFIDNSFLTNIVRDNSTIFSNREGIWAIGIAGLPLQDLYQLFLGTGSSGYINNPIAQEVTIFFSDRGENFGSMHNIYLQFIYEFGLLPLFVLTFGYYSFLNNTSSYNNKKILTPLLAYFFFVSATEATLSFSYLFLPLYFLYFYHFSVIFKIRRSKPIKDEI